MRVPSTGLAPTETPTLSDATPPPLVLASGSPRRRELLARLGLRFEVVVPNVDESPATDEAPGALARRLARAKALAVRLSRGTVVLAADTVVSRAGQLYAKPRDTTDAVRMLRELRGARHEVTTGVCVVRVGRDTLVGAVVTAVWMRAYVDAEIAAYVAAGEPFDKAGAYAIQDATFHPVARFEGCYSNVVGLPLCLTAALLQKAGLFVPSGDDVCDHEPNAAP
ncbi:MAG TPA: Maf family protein [Chloroflexota bacterium]|jgi:septum formation protein